MRNRPILSTDFTSLYDTSCECGRGKLLPLTKERSLKIGRQDTQMNERRIVHRNTTHNDIRESSPSAFFPESYETEPSIGDTHHVIKQMEIQDGDFYFLVDAYKSC